MMRSMFSGVSGLRTHQTKMDVIAHNISNVNTVGFKGSRVTFSETFSQTVQGATRASEITGRGGTNPMQIGLGVNVGSIDKNMSTGAAQRTDRALDLMINGDGFFIVGDASGTFFTRAGAFEIDAEGFMHMGGMRLQGWQQNIDELAGTVPPGVVADIRIGPQMQVSPPSTTTQMRVEGNLNPAMATGAEHPSTISFFDTLGNRWVVDVTFTKESTGDEPGRFSIEFGDYAFLNGVRMETPAPPGAVAVSIASPADIVFNASGTLATPAYPGVLNINITETFPGAATVGGVGGLIAIDFSAITQFGSRPSNAGFESLNGRSSGTLEGLSVGSDGIITGRYSNGDMRTLGQIPIARFRNPAGLEAVGRNLFVASPNSGEFNGNGEVTGNMMGGVLEMSNVDLSAEFTEMITTQRGFQASSRLISTSDEMLQELVNLRR